MDKNGKIFGKISIIDVLVIITIIVGAIGFSMRSTSIEGDMVKRKVKFEYVAEVEGVRSYTVDAMNKKGNLINPYTDEVLGKVLKVESEPYTVTQVLSNGKTVLVEIPELYKLKVTVQCNGKESEDAYFVGKDLEISVGSSIGIVTKHASTNGKVISVKKLG